MRARVSLYLSICFSFSILSACATFDQGVSELGPDGSVDDSENPDGISDTTLRLDSDSSSASDSNEEETASAAEDSTGDSASETETPPKKYEHQPGEPGPFGILEQSTKIDNEDATFYLPAAGDSAADGPFPLVIVHAGFRVGHGMYEHFSKHIASHGFLVVGIEMPGGDDNHQKNADHTIAVINWLLGDTNPHINKVDSSQIATAGHSLGGKIALFAAALDSRITNVVAWDPVDTGGPPCQIDPVGCKRWSVTPEMMEKVNAKLLIMGGLTGTGLFTCTPRGESHPSFFDEAKDIALHLDFPHSDHLDWMKDGGDTLIGLLGKLICGSLGSARYEDIHRIARQTQIAWLLKYAKGYTNLDQYLDGSALVDDIQEGIVVLEKTP